MNNLTSEVIRAARALLRWEQRNLAEASSISLPTIKRQSKPGMLEARTRTVAAPARALRMLGQVPSMKTEAVQACAYESVSGQRSKNRRNCKWRRVGIRLAAVHYGR